MNCKKLRNKLEQKKGQKKLIESKIKELKHEISKLRLEQINTDKASDIIQIVAKQTQNEIKYRICEPVTLAMESVLDEPYTFNLEFVNRRNQTECDLSFEQDGELFNPLKESTGGGVDIASFALRASLLSLHNPKPRNLIILDEPFKHLDREKHELAGEMLRKISESLNIQIIMTTHSKELLTCADKIFKVRKKIGKSYIENQ